MARVLEKRRTFWIPWCLAGRSTADMQSAHSDEGCACASVL